jgi:hypothetical protein
MRRAEAALDGFHCPNFYRTEIWNASFAQRERPAQRVAWLHNRTVLRVVLFLISIVVVFVVLENKTSATSLSWVSDNDNFTAEFCNVKSRAFEDISVFSPSPYIGILFADLNFIERITGNTKWNDLEDSPRSDRPWFEITRFTKSKIIWKGVADNLQRGKNLNVLGWRVSGVFEADRDGPLYSYEGFFWTKARFKRFNKNKRSFGIFNHPILAVHQFGLAFQCSRLNGHQFRLLLADVIQQNGEERHDSGRECLNPISKTYLITGTAITVAVVAICIGFWSVADYLGLLGDRRLRTGNRCCGWVFVCASNFIGVGGYIAILAGLLWCLIRWGR